jgi:hypothetical protein
MHAAQTIVIDKRVNVYVSEQPTTISGIVLTRWHQLDHNMMPACKSHKHTKHGTCAQNQRVQDGTFHGSILYQEATLG